MRKNCIISCLACLLFSFNMQAQSLATTGLTCEYRKDPAGIDIVQPRLSWQLVSTAKNVLQTAYEIRVKHNGGTVWNSGRVQSDQSVLIPYSGPALQSKQIYYWQVRVWDNHGQASPWSHVAQWEMGLLQAADWQAKWIRADTVTNGAAGPCPLFRKDFELAKAVKTARLYITAHGLYEAYFNGRRIGNAYFTPGWTSYHKRLQYQVYDVKALLQKGNNVADVTLGDGWYRGYLEFNNKRNLYGKEAALLFQLEIEYTDGTRSSMVSDESWHASFAGPIRFSDIYNGEIYDARLENSRHTWKPVALAAADKHVLTAVNGPAVIKQETFYPVRFIHTPNGETVADFGQNLVGWVKLQLKGRAGDTVTLHHAEVLDKAGNFYTANLRQAKQEIKYVFKGDAGKETYEPHFTFQGFRYVKITGYTGPLDTASLTAVALYSDMPATGTFVTSDTLINQLQHNIQWGQKGNFLDVPTDCPQRNERLGWTGDAQVFFNTAAFNRQCAGFFTKWLQDLALDQHANGNVPVVIPDVRTPKNAGSAGWGDVAVIIPWNLYQAYGDTRLLEQQYNSMKGWVNYIRSVSKNNLWNSGPHYGDWLFYSPTDDRDGKAAITDKYLIAQAFYAYSTQLLIHAAHVLNRQEDVQAYTKLLADIKQAFVTEYTTPGGRLVSGSQTAYVLALHFDLLPEPLRAQAAARLAENIKAYGNHLTTGFLGTPYLCHVLTRFGYNDLAYQLLLQDTYPSWLYPVKMGATTIWERWDGIRADGSFQNAEMNSFNHYAYGAIGDWMYRVIGGIQSDTALPGYRKMIIAPQPGGGLAHAATALETMYGKVSTAWKIKDQHFYLDVQVPPNTTAVIRLPQQQAVQDTTVGSGAWHFEYRWE